MNHDTIGEAAGSVWRRLAEKGDAGLSFAEIKKIPGLTGDEVMAAIGWLAREGKLAFRVEGRKVSVSLAEEVAV